MKPIVMAGLLVSVFYTIAISHANEADDELLLNQTSISDSELDNNRAQGTDFFIDDLNLNSVNLNASSHDNISLNSNTGSNIVDNAAFSNTSGFTTAILNSGNNVLIQSSVFVNIIFE